MKIRRTLVDYYDETPNTEYEINPIRKVVNIMSSIYQLHNNFKLVDIRKLIITDIIKSHLTLDLNKNVKTSLNIKDILHATEWVKYREVKYLITDIKLLTQLFNLYDTNFYSKASSSIEDIKDIIGTLNAFDELDVRPEGLYSVDAPYDGRSDIMLWKYSPKKINIHTKAIDYLHGRPTNCISTVAHVINCIEIIDGYLNIYITDKSNSNTAIDENTICKQVRVASLAHIIMVIGDITNDVLLTDLIVKYGIGPIKLYILSYHYNRDMIFSHSDLNIYYNMFKRIKNTHIELNKLKNIDILSEMSNGYHYNAIRKALDNDINTPRVIGILNQLLDDIDNCISFNKFTTEVSDFVKISHLLRIVMED